MTLQVRLSVFSRLPIFQAMHSFGSFHKRSKVRRGFIVFPRYVRSRIRAVCFRNAFYQVRVASSGPMFYGLVHFIPVFSFRPLSLVGHPRGIPTGLVRAVLHPILRSVSVVRCSIQARPLSDGSSVPLTTREVASYFGGLVIVCTYTIFIIMRATLPSYNVFFFLFQYILHGVF